MTFDDVLEEVIYHLGSNRDSLLSWEQVREWPEGAMESFLDSGWIKPAVPAKSVVCPGCEENCFMPVHIKPETERETSQAFVDCDRRKDMGRVPLTLVHLQQWQVMENGVARWIGRELGLKTKPKKGKTTRTTQIGDLQGKKNSRGLDLVWAAPTSLKISGHSLLLSEIVFFEGSQLQIDREAVLKMVDRLPPENRYNPSTARREARKLDTRTRYQGWKKVYRELKRKNPGKSDNWCALQIARMAIGNHFSSETIRKNMKR